MQNTQSVNHDFKERSTRILLLLVSMLCLLFSVLSILDAVGLPIRSKHTSVENSVITSVALFIVGFMGLCLREVQNRIGGAWPGKILTILLVFFVLIPLDPRLFTNSIPQVIWAPILVAFALTNLMWSIFISVLTALCVIALFSDTGSFQAPVPSIIWFGLLTVVTTFRVLYDRQFESEQEQRQRANYLALHDPLTGLPNRRMLERKLDASLTECKGKNVEMAVICLDLDHFSRINDTLGHDQGDELLIQISEQLKRLVRTKDTLSRFGGDEFVVLVNDVVGDVVQETIDRIRTSLGAPHQIQENSLTVTTSVGVALYPKDGAEANILLKHADQALYAAKRAGRNQAFFSTSELQTESKTRFELTMDLREAIQQKELFLVYQPIINLKTGLIEKAEALARWNHNSKGPISPGRFIPIAETTGLIGLLSEQVLNIVLLQVKSWRSKGCPIQMSVNLSPVLLREAHESLGLLRSTEELPMDQIVLEITEGVLLEATTLIKEQLEMLRGAGLLFSLDDFGTGYSSISYLHQHDIDFVKIDRSFVNGLEPDSKGFLLCKSIVRMTHALGMKVIAEGVETEEQLECLKNLGCDYAQGYYLGRPMSAAALEVLLVGQMQQVDPQNLRLSGDELDSAAVMSG